MMLTACFIGYALMLCCVVLMIKTTRNKRSRMKTETKSVHKVLKIIGIILLSLLAVGVIFFI